MTPYKPKISTALVTLGASPLQAIACRGAKAHKLPLEMHAQWRDTAMMFGPERICLR